MGRKLWYRQPAKEWLEALPIGNGRIGGMVFGRVAEETLALNEDSIWAGGYRDTVHPRAAEIVDKVREHLFARRFSEAAEEAQQLVQGSNAGVRPYQPLGRLMIRQPDAKEGGAYRRELDLATGVATTSYEGGRREAFVSAADDLLVVLVEGGFSATLTRQEQATVAADGPDLVLEGRVEGKGVRFHARLRALPRNGSIRVENGSIRGEGTDQTVLLLAAATDYWGGDPARRCEQALDAVDGDSYEVLLARHVEAHARLFDRVHLDLGKGADLPTDERLKQPDPDLAATYFEYGRYLLITGGGMRGFPANLQGIWNDQL
ncbi:MAG TPA: glycoside hydrolase family 95 protein, partial [Fimbriimonas sp.]